MAQSDDDKNEEAAVRFSAKVATAAMLGVSAAVFCGCQLRAIWFPWMTPWHLGNCPLK
jgi:hypothetical protein